VLIFRKTAAYSQQLVEDVLGGIDVERALHGLKPIEASAAPDALTFDPETWADQQAGGTWSEMFNWDGLLNRYPGLAAVAWWAAVTGLGWLAFPLLFATLPRLRDRGYGLARVLGLLLVAYLTWLAASLRVLPNTRGTILLMGLLLTLVGAGVGWRQRDELRRFLRRRWRLVLLIEGLFALLYAVWIGVRLLHPDLWHPIVGGEKPMNLAYLNAVLKSTWFPPYNPWFSGSKINYYYFGYVIIGALIKLVGTVPAIAYNLAVPLLFALTGVGAFSVAYNLFGGHRRGALLAGMMALVFTVLLGNLGVVQLIRESLIRLGGEPFSSTIPGFPETVAMLRGLWEVIAHGAKLPLRVESWYWHPTRIIPAASGEVGPITEFPAFTFLYADLHAHMIAFPLTLLALALSVYWVRDSRPRWSSLLIGGLVIGALRPTNTWDYPMYLVLGLVGLAIGALGRTRGQGDKGTGEQGDKGVNGLATDKRMRGTGVGRFVGWLRAFGWRGVVLVGLTMVLYLPYIQNYAMGYSSFNVWHGSRTPFNIVLWILGILLFPLVTRLLIEVWRSEKLEIRDWRLKGRRRWPALVVGVSGVVGTTLVLVAVGYQVALMVIPVGMLAAYLVLAPGSSASRRFLWFTVGSAMALCLCVEIIVLTGDIGRMNTVFKFYLQVWMLLSIAAAVSLAWVREYLEHWKPERRLEPAGEARLELAEGPHPEIVEERRPELVEGWRSLWWIGMGLLIFGGALFMPYGVRARAVDRMAPQTGLTLDGMAFMEHSVVFDGAPERGEGQEIPLSGDYAAIRWMQDHIQGSPVIMEGLGYREYLWGNRVSIHTGLPAVIGWRWHQVQQRSGVLPETTVDWRREDVRECYDTTDVALAREILDRYGVRYVYVGAYERAYYDPAGLAKFDAMAGEGMLRVVYDGEGTRIYETMNNDR
jgi:YYY domain-containing protein